MKLKSCSMHRSSRRPNRGSSICLSSLKHARIAPICTWVNVQHVSPDDIIFSFSALWLRLPASHSDELKTNLKHSKINRSNARASLKTSSTDQRGFLCFDVTFAPARVRAGPHTAHTRRTAQRPLLLVPLHCTDVPRLATPLLLLLLHDRHLRAARAALESAHRLASVGLAVASAETRGRSAHATGVARTRAHNVRVHGYTQRKGARHKRKQTRKHRMSVVRPSSKSCVLPVQGAHRMHPRQPLLRCSTGVCCFLSH